MNPIECPACGENVDEETGYCPACGHLFARLLCDRHPDRAAKGACVICGRALCKDCDQAQGMHHLCEDHEAVPVIEGWAQVYLAQDDIEAELIRENLVAEGIEARVYSQKDHFSFAVDLGELSQVRVLVPAYAYRDARTLMQAHRDEHGGVSFACQECGEAYNLGDTRCNHCGATLPGVGESRLNQQ